MSGSAAMIAVLLAPTASMARHDGHSTDEEFVLPINNRAPQRPQQAGDVRLGKWSRA